MEPRMTSSLPPNLVPARQSRAAFTLVELLVVIGIIVLLIAILLPAVNRAYNNSVRVRMEADLHTISQALEVYHNQFGDYPRPGLMPKNTLNRTVSGASCLCWALVAPGSETEDGAGDPNSAKNPYPGFRLRPGQGQIYGPYISLDSFNIGVPDANNVVQPNTGITKVDYDDVIADRDGSPILYFVANRAQSPAVSYVSNKDLIGTLPATCVFNFNDNAQYLPSGNATQNTLTLKVMRYRLGDHNTDGMIGSGESLVTTSPYILWSAGPDGHFGPQVNDPSLNAGATAIGGHDDDVANVPLDEVPRLVNGNPFAIGP